MHDEGHDLPHLLMLSHCVPDPRGTPQRQRAWQLLALAAIHHHVHLLCVQDQPIHLSQWRTLAELAGRIVIGRHGSIARLWHHAKTQWPGGAASTPSLPQSLRSHVQGLAQSHPIAAALCTHPAFLESMQPLAGVPSCGDLSPLGILQSPAVTSVVMRAAAHCDTLLISATQQLSATTRFAWPVVCVGPLTQAREVWPVAVRTPSRWARPEPIFARPTRSEPRAMPLAA